MTRKRARQAANHSADAQREGTMSSKAPNDPQAVVSEKSYDTANGNGRVKATLYLKKETLKKAKHIALEQDTTLSQLTQAALEKYMGDSDTRR